MAIERIGYSSVNNAGGVTDITFGPTGGTIQEGDWMVAVVTANQSQVLTVPTGWTAIRNMNLSGTLSTAIFIKKRGAEGNYSLHVTEGTLATVALMWFRGVADTGWVIGTGQNRNGTGSTFNNTAPSITTTANNMMSLVISTERTSATETSYSSITGATPWFYVGQTGSYLETTLIAYKDMPTAGPTGNIIVAYPNTQASNGYGIQLGLPMAAIPTGPLGPMRIYNGTQELPLTSAVWTGTAETPVTPSKLVYGNYNRANLFSTTPFYIAHRGSGGNWPEHTMRSYTGAADWGLKALEISTNITSDGVIVCHHDPSTLRMTGTDLTITASTKAQLDALTNKTSDTDNPGQDRQPIPLLSDVLAKFGHSHVLFIEPKTGGAWYPTLRSMIQQYVDADRVVWKQSAGGTGFATSQSLGWATWGYLISSDQFHLDNYQNWIATRTDIDMWGVERGASDVFITDVVTRANAVGKKVIMWDIPTIADRDRALALGCVGMMTSNVRKVLPKFP